MKDSQEQKTVGPEILDGAISTRAGSDPVRWESTFGLGRNQAFPATRWSLVVRAKGEDSQLAQSALAELCKRYWYALYAWLRCSGHSREDAEDLTQGFFSKLLAKGWLADFDCEKGKLRTFLLTALKRHALGQWRRAQAQKRGGGIEHIDLNYAEGEERFLNTLGEHDTPDKLYEKQWAITLLGRVTGALRDDYIRRQMGERYEVLKDALQWNSQSAPYAELGEKLGLTENAVKQAVRRLRRQYRRLLTEEIQATVESDDPQIVESELANLAAAFQS